MAYLLVQTSFISALSPGSCLPKSLHGKAIISKSSPPNSSYNSCSFFNCGARLHSVAIFTTSTFLPFKAEKSNSAPSIVFALKS